MISVEDARHSQNKNLVTRALGVDPEVEAEICDYEVLPGDIYLLCSDGLNDMVEDEKRHDAAGAGCQPGTGGNATDPDGKRQWRA